MNFRVTDIISIKSAIAGAIFMGGMVFWVNYKEGWQLASIAASKQAVYTFFLGGIFVRISEVIALKTKEKWMGVFLGTLVASLLTITAVFGMHNMKGTPKPFESTLPTIFFAPPGFIFLSWHKRNKEDKLKALNE